MSPLAGTVEAMDDNVWSEVSIGETALGVGDIGGEELVALGVPLEEQAAKTTLPNTPAAITDPHRVSIVRTTTTAC